MKKRHFTKELMPYVIVIVLCLIGTAILTLSIEPGSFAQILTDE